MRVSARAACAVKVACVIACGLLCLVVLGCGHVSQGASRRGIPGGFGFNCHGTPDCCLAPARRQGYRVPGNEITTAPRTAFVCRRVMQCPGGRMFAAMGFYHQWIYTPDAEEGMGFVGAEGTDYAGLPQPLSNVFIPMEVMSHRGAVLDRDVVVKPIQQVDYDRLVDNINADRKGGYFPICNCYGWTDRVIRRSRTAHQAETSPEVASPRSRLPAAER